MELALFIYLAGVVGGLADLLIGTFVIAVVGLFVFWVGVLAALDGRRYSFDRFSKNLRNATIGVFALGVITAVIPSEKTMYLMLAGYTAQTVIQSETTDKVLKVINTKLDSYLELATNSKKEK